jgi:hypothetical protein
MDTFLSSTKNIFISIGFPLSNNKLANFSYIGPGLLPPDKAMLTGRLPQFKT